MTLKRFYTCNVLLIYLTMVGARTPWLPIRRETKTFISRHRDSFLNFTELTAKYGYTSEEHKVVTDDGYVLTMFRILQARYCVHKKRSPPVLLMHGLLLSSDAWIDAGPNSGLAYLISDACFDLWMGNTRGNYYSREHISLNPDRDPEYWNFYIDEIGRYDLPAMIDYVLYNTDSNKLNYIGFSQGAGTFLVMCSERPGYCDKAQLFIALAPATRHLNTHSLVFKGSTQLFEILEDRLSKCGVHELLTKGTLIKEFVAFLCRRSKVARTLNLCEIFLNVFDNGNYFHLGSITSKTTRVLFDHFPAGTSLHNMARYGQSMRSSNFEKFNYGKKKNLALYGSEQPPEYNLSAVTVPVVCIYGKNDGIVDRKDVEWMMSKLPNVIEAVKVEDPLWNHMDVTYSQYTVDSVFPKIRYYLLKNTRESL